MKDLASRLDDHRTPDEVAEVSGSFQELHVDEEQNVEAESSRPTKRRRITQPDGTPNSQTLKARLIGDVYGLLGSQPAEDLDGLRNLAEWVKGLCLGVNEADIPSGTDSLDYRTLRDVKLSKIWVCLHAPPRIP